MAREFHLLKKSIQSKFKKRFHHKTQVLFSIMIKNYLSALRAALEQSVWFQHSDRLDAKCKYGFFLMKSLIFIISLTFSSNDFASTSMVVSTPILIGSSSLCSGMKEFFKFLKQMLWNSLANMIFNSVSYWRIKFKEIITNLFEYQFIDQFYHSQQCKPHFSFIFELKGNIW